MKRKIRLTESDLHKIISRSVKRIVNEERRKPKDVQHGNHKFKGLKYDRNGNPIYTHEGNTLSPDELKKMGWRMSKKHGLNGQISDPTQFYKDTNESINRTIKNVVNESIKRVLREIDERELDEDQLEEFEKADEVFARFENGERSHSLLMAADDAVAAFPYENTKKAQMYIKKLENILNVLDNNNDVYLDAWKNDDVEEWEP